jgi:hypothetical protein
MYILMGALGVGGILGIGLIPQHWAYASWLYAVLVGWIAAFNTGLVTLRTTMWHANYPDSYRARISARLHKVRILVAVLTGLLLSVVFDWQAWAYHVIYPGIALIGLLALLPLRRMRVRQERTQIRRYHAQQRRDSGALEHPLSWLTTGIRDAAGILRTDRMFAGYMGAQFLLGSANFFTDPLLVVVITKHFGLGYFASALLMQGIPAALMLVSMAYWAPLFDRVGVLRFRVYNSLAWLCSYGGVVAAMLLYGGGGTAWMPVVIGILVAARITNGVGRSSGAIAWHIGHLHFAREHQAELYMSIHVGLTGLRALVMPVVGLACFQAFGYGAFVVSLVLATIGHLLFRNLVRIDARRGITTAAAAQ